MTSYSQGTGWTPILLETAENVRGRVRKALLSRPALDIAEMKGLLDAEAQAAVEETLRESGVSIHVISEEGDVTIGEGGLNIIVDPVDGTTNLARGIPLAVTSLAVSETSYLSGVLAGVVMDLYTGEVFRAERHRGAWRGGRRINPARPVSVKGALVSVDISKGASIEPVRKLIRDAGHLRQLGSSALSLCHLASGIIDVHVDLRGSLRSTDVAAGLLILKEAGGIYSVNGFIGGDLELSRETTLRLVAASSAGTLEEIIELVD